MFICCVFGCALHQKAGRNTQHLLLTFFSGPQPSTEKPEGPYPTLVTQPNGRVVPVVQAYAYTKYLGLLKLTFDDEGELSAWEGEPILLNSSYPQGILHISIKS